MTHRLSALFDIEPGEGRPVLLLLACSFFLGSSITLVSSVAYALFLSQLGAEQLPYVYMATGVVVTVSSFVYVRLSDRLTLPTLAVVAVAFVILVLVGARLGLALTAALWVTFALPVVSDLANSLTNITFWNLAGRVFNLRQGKRLFGMIGGGWELAKAAGGYLIPVLVLWMGTANVMLAAAIGIACALALILYLVRSGLVSPLAPANDRPPATQAAAPSPWWKSRYVLLILGLYAALMLTWCTLDLIFYDQADLRFAGEERLASFLGLFFGTIGLLNLLGRTFLTARLLKRWGVPGALLVSPLVLLANGMLVAGVAAAFGTLPAFFFWLVATMRLLLDLLTSTADMPVLNILYQPLPAPQRLKAQALVDGAVYSLSIGLSGVGLWALSTLWELGAVPLSAAVLVLVSAWTAIAVGLRREYPRRLRQALARRRLGAAPEILMDSSARALLQQELRNPSPGVVSYALTMLETASRETVVPSLPALLDHPSPEVRRDALQRMERLGLTDAAEAVRRRLAVEPSPAVRGAAVRTLAALLGPDACEPTFSFLEDPAPEIRRGAMAGLLRHGGIEGVLAAGNRLLQIAASSEPAERMLAAQVLGDVGADGFYQPLLALLGDESHEVQRAALGAAGQLRSAHLWPLVVAGLGSPHLRGASASALVSGGAASLPALFAGFDEAAAQPLLQRRLLSVCGRIGGTRAVAWLQAHLDYPHCGVRTQVLHELSRCGYCAPLGEVAQVVAQIKAEVTLSAELVALESDVGEDDSVELLRGALRHLLVESRARIFFLLSFLHDRSLILRARDNLALDSAEKRAYAFEVLDLLVAPDLKTLLFPLLTDQPAGTRARQVRVLFRRPVRSHQQCLEEIITDSSGQFGAWPRACALYAAGNSPAAAPADAVAEATAARDPLVSETALWALARLGPGALGGHRGRLPPQPGRQPAVPAPSVQVDGNGGRSMLTAIEKVIALKGAAVFAGVPDEVLAALAPCLEEMEYGAGQTVFEKGDLGDCMYIIADGTVQIHDGERTLNTLQVGEVLGEMAVLDAEPRSASATATVDSLLLRLDQQPLYEAMEDWTEIAHGIIRVLSRHLRARLSDLSQLHAELER